MKNNNKDWWSELNTKELSDVIGFFVKQKIYFPQKMKELYNISLNNKYEDGGPIEEDKSLFDKLKLVAQNIIYPKYKGTFNQAFREARNNGEESFMWNNKRYSTEIKPNPFVEAAKVWNTNGNLAKEDFRMEVIRNPNEVLNYYNNKYPARDNKTTNAKINAYNLDTMYSLGTGELSNLVINRYQNNNLGNEIWDELNKSNLSYEQKLAMLANSYYETNGWTALRQYNDGPASGIFMMEGPQRKVYKQWLKDNKLTDSATNQTKFVVELFNNNDSSLITAWDRAGDKQNTIRTFKDSDEAYKNGYRSAYNHMDYTTEQANKDWKSNNIDSTVRAFEGLFERAGIPEIERRQRIAHILKKRYK